MKRIKLIGIMIVVCAVTLCAALFGCNAKLNTPDGLKYSDETFSWNAVAGADGYMVHVNEAEDFYITEASIDADDENLSGGLKDKDLNVLYVRAVTVEEDGSVKKSSETASYEFDYAAPAKKEWKVSFDLNYTDSPAAQTVTVKSGDNFNKPTPTRHGYTFGGWYRDKQCLVAANFTASGVSNFNVTADTTLYAKWTVDSSVAYTTVYYYTEDWEQVKVQPCKGETKLYSGEGISMVAYAGQTNWFKANIDDTATSVIFTNGEDSTKSAAFDKSTPYCKYGEWTANIPVDDIPVEGETVVTIRVGTGAPQELTENPEVEGEYMIELELSVGDKVVIAIDGKTVSNYDEKCTFQGTAAAEGVHKFYVTVDRIWVESPKAPSNVKILINGVEATDFEVEKNEKPDDGRLSYEYACKVDLKVGDKIKIFEGTFEYKSYEEACNFTGTAEVEGTYTFYAKKYKDGTESVWVVVPKNNVVPTTSTMVYFHNTKGWSKVNLYCWNYKSGAKPVVWPGAAMTDMGNGWFSLEIQPGYDMIIFNNGSAQTADLDFEVTDGKAYYNFNGVTTDRPNA